MKIEKILEIVGKEVKEAQERWKPFNSAHEAYAILLEEVDELWEMVKYYQKNKDVILSLIREAIQVAAMAIRLTHDVSEKHEWFPKDTTSKSINNG